MQLLDYTNFRGEYYSRQNYPPCWIKAKQSSEGADATTYQSLTLRNVITDEGTDFCDIEDINQVIIEGCRANQTVNGDGDGRQGSISLKNVKHAASSSLGAGISRAIFL